MMMRRACIQTVIENGFMRALSIQIGQNRLVNCWGQDRDNLISHGWNVYVAGHNDVETTGYDSAAIEGRLLLRLAEAEAQLENFNMAAIYAERAAELLSTLDRGRPATSTMEKRLGHPARQLIIPARGIAKRMAAMKTTGMIEAEGDTSKKKKKKGGGKKKGKKK
mmetsp:Transcript_60798/g.166965  ORF Transcript_60798/g.166965 Transcript_60798/m.166965 type:complete len:165 (-) Transcript_60798:199-693(-)